MPSLAIAQDRTSQFLSGCEKQQDNQNHFQRRKWKNANLFSVARKVYGIESYVFYIWGENHRFIISPHNHSIFNLNSVIEMIVYYSIFNNNIINERNSFINSFFFKDSTTMKWEHVSTFNHKVHSMEQVRSAIC